MMNSIHIAITGASGTIYAQRLVDLCLSRFERIYLTITSSGQEVANFELDANGIEFCLKSFLKNPQSSPASTKVKLFSQEDLWAPCASGTAVPDAMVVIPCSMGTLARIAGGLSTNLLERSADVILKQKKPLIICPRESPLNRIHLENMLRLDSAGAHIVPLMPGFYQHPKAISELVDFMCGRVLELLGQDHALYKPWSHRRL